MGKFLSRLICYDCFERQKEPALYRHTETIKTNTELEKQEL
jgi:hypothetical protein